MGFNHKEQQNRQDHILKKRMLALQDLDYDTRKGWHQLAGQLKAGHQPVKKQLKGKIFFIWKMAAAAIILLLIGFFTGRLTSKPDFPLQQTTAVTSLSNNQLATQTNSIVSKETESSAQVAVTGKPAITEANKQITKKKTNIPQQKTTADKQKYANNNPARQEKYQNDVIKIDRSVVRHDSLPTTGKKAQYALNGLNTIPDKIARSGIKTATHAIHKPVNGNAGKSLPIMSLSEINTIPAITSSQPQPYRNGILRESVYRKLGNNNGSSSYNPFQIRL